MRDICMCVYLFVDCRNTAVSFCLSYSLFSFTKMEKEKKHSWHMLCLVSFFHVYLFILSSSVDFFISFFVNCIDCECSYFWIGWYMFTFCSIREELMCVSHTNENYKTVGSKHSYEIQPAVNGNFTRFTYYVEDFTSIRPHTYWSASKIPSDSRYHRRTF